MYITKMVRHCVVWQVLLKDYYLELSARDRLPVLAMLRIVKGLAIGCSGEKIRRETSVEFSGFFLA